MRFSAVREIIYNTILNDKDHPTADIIYHKLKSSNPQLSLATIYRNLKQLEQSGSIIKITSQGSCDHYDARIDKHYHMFCVKCGKMFDVECDFDNNIINSTQTKTDHKILNYELCFVGICKECREIR